MMKEIIKNAEFPDFELPDEKGNIQKLSELQGGDPVALMLPTI
jgi:peroxiredoxin